MIQTSYSEARERLASLMDKATDDRETVIIKRRGHPDVALIAADELAGLEETAHLLRSPANAVRLFEGLARAVVIIGGPSEEKWVSLPLADRRGDASGGAGWEASPLMVAGDSLVRPATGRPLRSDEVRPKRHASAAHQAPATRETRWPDCVPAGRAVGPCRR
jgi:antitoxin YefM